MEKRIKLPVIDDYEKAIEEAGDFAVSVMRRVNATGGVIGLSGGVDSTVTAAIVKRAFDRAGDLTLEGYVLPTAINDPGNMDDGERVGEALGIECDRISIQPIVDAYSYTNPEVLHSEYDRGNLMSRIRANVLHTKAASHRKIVLGTGNQDEDFSIGYYTLFGDGAVHISPIGCFPKRIVKALAKYLGFPEIAEKTPTAGLESGQTDFGDLGYTYEAVEVVIAGFYQGIRPAELASHSQVRAEVEPYLAQSKWDSVDEVVNDILWRHENVAKPKLELLHPKSPELTCVRYE